MRQTFYFANIVIKTGIIQDLKKLFDILRSEGFFPKHAFHRVSGNSSIFPDSYVQAMLSDSRALKTVANCRRADMLYVESG